MNEIIKTDIENLIYEIRGKEVMLDSDLANLYGVETKRINEAVRRNKEKFPERFTWTLDESELQKCSRSQFATLNEEKVKRGQNIKYLPRVFTEQGVAMLATILKSKEATEVSIRIMDAFVAMRHYLIENKDIYKSLNIINNMLDEHDDKLNYLFSRFDKKEILFLKNHEYDAYSNIIDILNEAKEEIIIIDGYADKTFLDIISKVNSNVTLITKSKSLISKLDLEKYNKQYDNLKVIYNDDFHDRFIILDKSIIYHLGSSINYAGSKTFVINKLEDKEIKKILIERIDCINERNN